MPKCISSSRKNTTEREQSEKKNRYLIGMCGNKHGIDYISATFYRKRERKKAVGFCFVPRSETMQKSNNSERCIQHGWNATTAGPMKNDNNKKNLKKKKKLLLLLLL